VVTRSSHYEHIIITTDELNIESVSFAYLLKFICDGMPPGLVIWSMCCYSSLHSALCVQLSSSSMPAVQCSVHSTL